MGWRVGVLGATGAVGREVVRLLEERDFPVDVLRLWASQRSAGEYLTFRGEQVEVADLAASPVEGVDFLFSAVGDRVAREVVPAARRAGAVVIDKSAAFRLDPEVPLVVPEVNPEDLEDHRGIVASPNCSTIQLVVALAPLAREVGLEKVVVSTYQSVSGTGREAVEELYEQTRAVLEGREPRPRVYPHPIAFNLFPHIDSFAETGYCREEMKLIRETRKILHLPDLAITATVARVPVVIGHAEAVWVRTTRPLPPERVRALLEEAPGVVVRDEPASCLYPTPREAAGQDAVMVGRIRADLDDERGVWMWVVADNLRKGAATNAVQIAELLAGSRGS
ncbi:MAG: aspartate-semialdehyde dehydrogenase [Bacillota bacterium]|nr:aspartate-semialdehyde dehydrogenase [Bacillota bacterium]MDI7249677.1 aspartate-semialdehyde dehydrogenase [Bacillota bacterium]